MVLIKKSLLIFLFLSLPIMAIAYDGILDSKYVKVGYVSNIKIEETDNTYLYNIGRVSDLEKKYNFYNNSPKDIEEQLNAIHVGKHVLDLILNRDRQGLHINSIYELALSNVAQSENERALLDVSAEKDDVLKRTIARQLLKNLFIIIVGESNTNSRSVVWRVYHVDIDDHIIDQVFANWNNNITYSQIRVPVSFVAQGKADSQDKVLLSISDKYTPFAPRSPILSRHPFVVGFGSTQGVKPLDLVDVYRLHENGLGEVRAKRICSTRVTEVSNETSRLFSINGGYASQSKGDIAVVRIHRKLNYISLVAQGSFGEDYRYGCRLFYERLRRLSKYGVSQYVIGTFEYNRYCREPLGFWISCNNPDREVQPTLCNVGGSIGYSIGLMGLLGKVELVSYVLAGAKIHFFDQKVDFVTSVGSVGYGGPQADLNCEFCGGIKMNINIFHPIQVTFGADYNYNLASIMKKSSLNIYYSFHTINRFNVYAGLRFNF